MTVRQAREWGASLLSDLEDPKLEADLLLLHVLGWPRHRLLLEGREPLAPRDLESYRRAVMARRARTPLQHITGSVEFMGSQLLAGPEALVPRPETEVLVRALLERLPAGPSMLLDVGTGSAAIALALAARRPDCRVVATDIDLSALELARRNLRSHGAGNVSLLACHLASACRGGFDGIAANLPYVPSGEIGGLQPEVRLGDPIAALDGGSDGLELVRALVRDLRRLLGAGATAALEVADNQAETVAAELRDAGLRAVEIVRDLAGRRRVVCGTTEGEHGL